MTFKEFLSKRENLADRTHLESAKKSLHASVYKRMWFEACDAFKAGMSMDIPKHQKANKARQMANLVITKYRNGYRGE